MHAPKLLAAPVLALLICRASPAPAADTRVAGAQAEIRALYGRVNRI